MPFAIKSVRSSCGDDSNTNWYKVEVVIAASIDTYEPYAKSTIGQSRKWTIWLMKVNSIILVRNKEASSKGTNLKILEG